MVSFAAPETQDDTLADWTSPSRASRAWRDLVEGFKRNWLWTALAFQDIKLRYRGSVLGPFWLTISTLVMVVAMGFIYAHLFHTNARAYMPYLSLGLIVWQLISSLITEGCQTFLASEAVIQQVPIPFSIHAYRVVYRNLFVFAHNLVIVPLGIVVFGIPIDWHVIEVPLGAAALAVNGVWIAIFLGIVSARFRDIAPIVASFLQVAFFLTPVFWPIDALGAYKWIAEFNPLFAAIDVIRAPLIGVPVATYSWLVIAVTTAIGCTVTFVFFARYRGRIAYWI